MKIDLTEIKNEYNQLLKSGMFWEFHPELIGNWENDKIKYKKIYRKIKKFRELHKHNNEAT